MSNGDRVSGRLLICARPVSQGCKVTCDSVSGSTSQFYAFPLPGVLRCSLENMKNVKQRLKNQRVVMSLVNKKISDAQQRGTFYGSWACARSPQQRRFLLCVSGNSGKRSSAFKMWTILELTSLVHLLSVPFHLLPRLHLLDVLYLVLQFNKWTVEWHRALCQQFSEANSFAKEENICSDKNLYLFFWYTLYVSVESVQPVEPPQQRPQSQLWSQSRFEVEAVDLQMRRKTESESSSHIAFFRYHF